MDEMPYFLRAYHQAFIIVYLHLQLCQAFTVHANVLIFVPSRVYVSVLFKSKV